MVAVGTLDDNTKREVITYVILYPMIPMLNHPIVATIPSLQNE